MDAETKDSNSLFAALDLNFSIDLCAEEGCGTLELVPGGKDVEVTASNVYDYVRKYAEYRMVKAQEKAIEVSLIILKKFGCIMLIKICFSAYSNRSI